MWFEWGTNANYYPRTIRCKSGTSRSGLLGSGFNDFEKVIGSMICPRNITSELFGFASWEDADNIGLVTRRIEKSPRHK